MTIKRKKCANKFRNCQFKKRKEYASWTIEVHRHPCQISPIFPLSKQGNFYFFPLNKSNNTFFSFFFFKRRDKSTLVHSKSHHSSSTRLILPPKGGGGKKFATSRNNTNFAIYIFYFLISEIFYINRIIIFSGREKSTLKIIIHRFLFYYFERKICEGIEKCW